jgi:hypothetical protein
MGISRAEFGKTKTEFGFALRDAQRSAQHYSE